MDLEQDGLRIEGPFRDGMGSRVDPLLDTMKGFISMVDRDYVYEAVNDPYCRAQNKTRQEVLGKTVAALWGQETFEKVLKARFDRCFSGEEIRDEAWITFPALDTRYYEVIYSPYSPDASHVTHVAVLTYDITDRKNLEEALFRSEEKFSKAFHGSPTLMAINTLTEGRFAEVNEAFVKTTGYSREEIIGETSTGLALWVDPGQREEMARSLVEKGELVKREVCLRAKTGEVRTGIFSASLIDFNGEEHVIAIFDDISDRKRAEEELQKHRNHLEELVSQRTMELSQKSRDLNDANAALRSLLKVKEEDVLEFETKVLANIKELVLPSLQRLKIATEGRHSRLIDILESNLNNILSPFMRKIGNIGFTPKEAEVANLIRNGKTIKDIAHLLGMSPRSVERHRYNMRKKLKLNRVSVNLQSYLQSLT
jgi:PAS domain S-box-containing protein